MNVFKIITHSREESAYHLFGAADESDAKEEYKKSAYRGSGEIETVEQIKSGVTATECGWIDTYYFNQ